MLRFFSCFHVFHNFVFSPLLDCELGFVIKHILEGLRRDFMTGWMVRDDLVKIVPFLVLKEILPLYYFMISFPE